MLLVLTSLLHTHEYTHTQLPAPYPRAVPSWMAMMWGWLSDDMISISRRMCIRSCSSLILSFLIDLMATWKVRMQETEEKGLAGRSICEDTLGSLVLGVYLPVKQAPGCTQTIHPSFHQGRWWRGWRAPSLEEFLTWVQCSTCHSRKAYRPTACFQNLHPDKGGNNLQS